MPRRRVVDTLQVNCMTSIAKNFEKICYGLQETQLFALIYDNDAFLQFSSPFKDLPSAIVDEFYEVLCEKRTVSRHMLHMLFNENNRIIRLRQGMGEIYYAIRFLMDRCSNLTVLDLAFMDQMGPQDLLRLFEPLRTLMQVNLRRTLTVTEVVSTIARNCPDLSELNLSETPVTDKSIVALCRTRQTNGASLKHAQKLRRLVLNDVTVSPEGLAVALESLPRLSDVEYHNMFRALECLPKCVSFLEDGSEAAVLEDVATTRLLVTKLQSTGEYISPESIDAALVACPYVQSVSLAECPGFENASLAKFLGFAKLTQLSVTNDDDRSLDFFEGVMPILQVRGQQMQNLILTDFLVVDIDLLASTCPNLQNLALSGITDYHVVGDDSGSEEGWSTSRSSSSFDRGPADDESEGAASNWATTSAASKSGRYPAALTRSPGRFEHLKALEVWSAPGHPGPCKAVLRTLMAAATKLQHLLVQGCVQFDDGVFFEIAKVNPMKKLSHFTANECSITTSTLLHLLDVENDLDMIRIWSCPGVDRASHDEVQARIKRENLEIYFEWYR